MAKAEAEATAGRDSTGTADQPENGGKHAWRATAPAKVGVAEFFSPSPHLWDPIYKFRTNCKNGTRNLKSLAKNSISSFVRHLLSGPCGYGLTGESR
jgi:hypothetical protein